MTDRFELTREQIQKLTQVLTDQNMKDIAWLQFFVDTMVAMDVHTFLNVVEVMKRGGYRKEEIQESQVDDGTDVYHADLEWLPVAQAFINGDPKIYVVKGIRQVLQCSLKEAVEMYENVMYYIFNASMPASFRAITEFSSEYENLVETIRFLRAAHKNV